jgi:hypothetical protein
MVTNGCKRSKENSGNDPLNYTPGSIDRERERRRQNI